MDLCCLQDDLLRKIFLKVLSVRVLILPPSNYYPHHFQDKQWRVFRACCCLGMTCERLRALFSMQHIRQHVMPQIRTIRYDFLRRVAADAAHAVKTRPLTQIWLTARLHLQEQWLFQINW